jgi:hypothetical protein
MVVFRKANNCLFLPFLGVENNHQTTYEIDHWPQSGLPLGIFAYQKYQFLYILEGPWNEKYWYF